jgi:hypothetical protein
MEISDGRMEGCLDSNLDKHSLLDESRSPSIESVFLTLTPGRMSFMEEN